MITYAKGNEINVFRDGDWIFLNNPCLTDGENKEKSLLATFLSKSLKQQEFIKLQ